MTDQPRELLNLDTVVVVDAAGYDEDFTIKTHPGMLGWIEPGVSPGRAVMHIEIPIEWVVIDDADGSS